MLEVHPLTGMGEIRPGDDLCDLLRQALERLPIKPDHGDILAITQKIVSKAEDRYVDLATVEPDQEALELARKTGKDARLVELILREADVVLRAEPGLLIMRHRLGLVMANAGIDQSNIGTGRGERVLLLPESPDLAARKIHDALLAELGIPLPVIITDSFGRPWRNGVTGVAIGVSGMSALVDRRGEVDRDGRTLAATQVAFADLIASAAMLVTGEGAESIPAVLVRGLKHHGAGTARDLIRPLAEDLFQ